MLFYELIQVAIGKQICLSHTPSDKEWASLFETATKQSLIGICFAAIEKLHLQKQVPPTKLLVNWVGLSERIKVRNEIVNQHCTILQERLRKNGFRCCILKGQGVGKLYDNSLTNLRSSGDIDIWIDATKEQVISYVMEQKPTSSFDQKHINYNCFKDTEVEAHWIPVKRCSPKIDRILSDYFEKERDRQFQNIVDGICMPTVDFQLVHQLLHVYGHYLYEGIGLRQMMDLYFTQIACIKDERDKLPEIIALFSRMGLMKFVAAAQWVLQEVFKLEKQNMICEPNSKEGRLLLDEILTGGNFGHYDKSNNIEDESFVGRFWRRWMRRLRKFRFDPLGTILMPYERIKLELWMRKVRKQYNV